MIGELIQNGANVKICDKEGKTALHHGLFFFFNNWNCSCNIHFSFVAVLTKDPQVVSALLSMVKNGKEYLKLKIIQT